MYKNIIFDLGGVMVDFDPKTYLVDRFCNAEVEEQVSQLTFESEEWKLLDAGLITRSEANLRMLARAKEYGRAFEVQGVLDDWMHILRPRRRMQELVRKLKSRGYCVYYLSNIPEDVLDFLTERDLKGLFDGGVASCEVHINKPDPRIYKALLDKYQLKAGESIFIDDRLENVQAAFRLGFAGIQMKDSVGTWCAALLPAAWSSTEQHTKTPRSCPVWGAGRGVFCHYRLFLFVILAVVRGLHLLGGAGAVLCHFDLGQITLAALHIVAALADIAGHTCVFHFYRLLGSRLPRLQAIIHGCLFSCVCFTPCLHCHDHMLDGENGMHRQHSGPGPAHDSADLFPHLRLIAMHLAGRAKGLGLHKGAVLNPGQCIIMELLALRAETASEGVMLLAAVKCDHLADQQFFIVSLFGKVFRGGL